MANRAGRRLFFEDKRLGFAEGYSALLGGAPIVQGDDSILEGAHGDNASFNTYFNKRIVSVLRPNWMTKNLPRILQDTRTTLDELALQPQHQTDCFESVYRLIFKFTVRTVACNEMADDSALLEKTLLLFEALDATATPMSISFPWMPTAAKAKRLYYGARLFKIFNDVVKQRQSTDRHKDDALQSLLDEGDKLLDILTFVLGALFAGQLNSGINTAYALLHLVVSPDWLSRAREEVDAVADRYAPNVDLPLKDRLMHVPLQAWEQDFPALDFRLRETIRLQTVGNGFRQNVSGEDIPIDNDNSEIVPKGAYVTFALGNVH